jgi:hypothetical protein
MNRRSIIINATVLAALGAFIAFAIVSSTSTSQPKPIDVIVKGVAVVVRGVPGKSIHVWQCEAISNESATIQWFSQSVNPDNALTPEIPFKEYRINSLAEGSERSAKKRDPSMSTRIGGSLVVQIGPSKQSESLMHIEYTIE